MGLLVFVLQIFSKHDMGKSVASDICCYTHVKDAKTTPTRPSLPDTNMPSRAEITINMQDRTHHRPHPACLPQPGVTSGCRSPGIWRMGSILHPARRAFHLRHPDRMGFPIHRVPIRDVPVGCGCPFGSSRDRSLENTGYCYHTISHSCKMPA